MTPTDGVALSIEWELDWPYGGYEPYALQRMQSNIENFIFQQTAYGADLNSAFDNYCHNFGNLYKSANQEYIQEAIEFKCEISPVAGWEVHLKGQMMPQYNGIVSYVCLYYDYTGGAHGDESMQAMTLNTRTGAVITIGDLFYGDSWSLLTRLVRKYLPKTLGENINMVEDPNIYPSDVFYVSPKGLTYVYEKYSIGAGALGVVKVTIPWAELPALNAR